MEETLTDYFDKKYPGTLECVICVGTGWKKILEEVVIKCHEHNVKVIQVKEKFGGLRFYVDSAPEVVYEAIELAELQALKVCEDCGEIDRVTTGGKGWVRTLCPNCMLSWNNR